MKLNRRGDVCYPHPTGLYVNEHQISAQHATDASWISDDEVACQLDGLTGWRVVRVNATGGTAHIVAPYGASPVRAGGGTIAWWTLEGGVQVNDLIQRPEWQKAGLCEVSPEGRIVTTPDYQVGEDLEVRDADGSFIHWLKTGPIGSAAITGYNVRLRGDALLYQDSLGWHLVEGGLSIAPFVPRTEPVALAVHAPMPNGRIVIMELSERLTVRYADTSKGIVITESDTFYPDMRQIGDETVELAWSKTPDELPQNVERAQVTLFELDHATFDLNSQEPTKPVDCVMSDWFCGNWVNNGDGTESQTCFRKVITRPANGGKTCPTDLSKVYTRPIEEPPMPVPTDRQKQIEALGFKCFGGFYTWTDPADCYTRVNQVAGIGADVMQNPNFVPSEFEAGEGLAILVKLGFDTPEAQQAVRRFFEGRK